MTPTDLFCLSAATLITLADISEISDGEIWPLSAKNPVSFDKIKDWDKKLVKGKLPCHGDLGLNNKREVYWFTQSGEWRKVA